MIKGRTLQGHISEKMKEPGFKKAWNDLDAEFNILEMVMKTGKKPVRRISAKRH
jgi:hypothetical protein